MIRAPGPSGAFPTVYVWRMVAQEPAWTGPSVSKETVPSASGWRSLTVNSWISASMLAKTLGPGWIPSKRWASSALNAVATWSVALTGTGPSVRE